MKNAILKAITGGMAALLFMWVVFLDSIFELPFPIAVIAGGWLYYFCWANDWFEEKKRSRHGARP